MNAQRYPEESRTKSSNTATAWPMSHTVGVSTIAMYKWMKLQQISVVQRLEPVSQSEEIRRLKVELK